MTKAGRAFRKEVIATVEAVDPMPFSGRLAVHLELTPPTRRRLDIDNYCKSAIDALMHAGVFIDDEQIDELRVTRLPVESPGCCDATIVELSPAAREGS
jgi:crossover junction endodeoxyribonuclease RusA